MDNISYLRNIIDERFKTTGQNNVAFLMRFLSKTEERELSRWYKVTLEPLGYVLFERRNRKLL
ncbi:hypothetical protein ES695_18070 [Candidatus Atribacteria bacterium 1244-E10-H5-B2]|nr:MAG: hypothetical protein ES695_18070 [Candidatus Atribacteria bacterium 1244-E10-H5-B2]